ncbi:hypothetical protein PUNSTDRAFT_51997 [Punctularia strigosozonata HHB-11173 SS5]|uniref:uncharacterized protein n=1 Tax=Punctularia strigosozonata (strain HHB-11173) TaxID=741275 RepID=UPI0004417D0E|nr:uncharacterized protein PUNSTDRAFT_51997 [Punctularia strigosozonata HHB-11173 SS5]EIN09805.1 hypothetical protein PUNSTDRAFT_51997 [Punctularia strigosozonata HHB-11173 SS5]
MSTDPAAAPRLPYAFSLGTDDELDAYAVVNAVAFDGPVIRAMFPGLASDPEGYYAFRRAENLKAFKDPNISWGKVVRTDTGEVVAVGRWSYHDGRYAPKAPSADEVSKPHWAGANDAFRELFSNTLDRHHKMNMGDQPHYVLNMLATKPEYQGRGAISPIIRHVLDEAKRKNLPTYIEASPAGLPVYKHFGWKELPNQIHIPLPSGETFDVVAMIHDGVSE